MRRAVAVAGVYVAAALALTWPLVAQLGTRLGALEGAGDPYLDLRVLGWGIRAWQQDPWGTLTGRAFDAPIFHPAPLTPAYGDHQLLQALVAAPVEAATGNLALAYNVVLLASIAASGLAMHALARAVTGSTWAAFLGGLAWACWPYRTAHLLDLQEQALYLMPLAFWALTRVAARRRWRDAGLLGLTSGLQAIASVSYGVITAVALVVAAPVLGWTTGQWRASRYWTRVLAAGTLAALLVLPVSVPYLRSQGAEGFGRSRDEASNQAASLRSYTQVPPDNLVYGRTGLLAPRPPAPGDRDPRGGEHQMFPGLVLLGLAGWGLWVGWRTDAKAPTIMAAALVATGFWLSLGPEGPLGLYRYLAAHLPGFDAIRAPARFGALAMLGAALLAALGLARIVSARPARASALAGALLAAMLLEYANAPLAFVTAPATDTPVGRWLRDAAEPGAVVYLPIGSDRENTPAMVAALQHGRPIVNGYSGQRPAAYPSIVESLSTLPGAEGLAVLKDLGVRFVVAPAWQDLSAAAPPLVERARYDGAVIYEVRWTPESDAALETADLGVPPPPPGPIPFGAGEEATYVVRWIGDLAAGQIALRASLPAGADRNAWPTSAWRFEAAASTAPWVSRFFEARDVFTTLATEGLWPLVHIRDVDEGARQFTLAYVYDADRRQVRSGATVAEASGTDAPASPLRDGARDAVSALFYLRTLPLAPGDELAVPVNDGGRSLMARVQVEGVETLSGSGGPVEAVRLSVAIEHRLERPQGLGATLWISADRRRVPVRLDLTIGFGRLRVELVDYRP